eukprot:PITA_18830
MSPFPHPSISKARYVLTFIDDFSHFTWVFFLKLKSKVFECLIEFKALAENKSGCKIKILCIDNGGEYVNKDVQQLCIDAARSVKFEEESLHDFSADPTEELLVATDEEESKTYSSTSKQPSEKPIGSDLDNEEQVMAAPTQLPTWVEKTLQDVGELVSDPADARRTRSQFFGDSQALDAAKPLLPIHFYMTLGSNPQSHSEATVNLLWEATMDEEYYALMENNTWDLVPLPKGRKLVRCQWINQKNIVVDGGIRKYKD